MRVALKVKFHIKDETLSLVKVVTDIYIYIKSKNLEKIQLDLKWIFIFMPHVPFNFKIFVASKLLNTKIEESKNPIKF